MEPQGISDKTQHRACDPCSESLVLPLSLRNQLMTCLFLFPQGSERSDVHATLLCVSDARILL